MRVFNEEPKNFRRGIKGLGFRGLKGFRAKGFKGLGFELKGFKGFRVLKG